MLLLAVIAVNLLLDLLYRGWVLCLFHCLTDILEQTGGNVSDGGSQDMEGSKHTSQMSLWLRNKCQHEQ